MPVYCYECESCGPFEEVQSMKDDRLTSCPRCGGKCQRVLPPPVPVHFVDHYWEQENGGKGRYISQLASRKGDPEAYCRNREEIIRKAEKRGQWPVD